MAENLNYGADGSVCYNNSIANCEIYGRLYNWETALAVCPPGWRLPSDAEWETLTDYAGGFANAGTKLKAASGWGDNGNGTNDYGFSAFPGGLGFFSDNAYVGMHGYWWTASESDADSARAIFLMNDRAVLTDSKVSKNFLFSVRCIKDDSQSDTTQTKYYKLSVINGAIETGDTLNAAGDTITIKPSGIPDGYGFGYWSIYPAISGMDIRKATLSFSMPKSDVKVRAVFSKLDTAGAVVADILGSADIENWDCGNSCQISEDDGKITITATGGAIIKTDMSPNIGEEETIISVIYATCETWRLYLDIPNIPYENGYFVELEPDPDDYSKCGYEAFKPFMRAYFALLKDEASLSSITKTFSLSDFKNELGQQISEVEAANSTGMSFARAGGDGGSSTISISGLSISLSNVSGGETNVVMEVVIDGDRHEANSGSIITIPIEKCSAERKVTVNLKSHELTYGDNVIEDGRSTVTVNNPIPFDKITISRWGNTLTVINNPENLPEGYGRFTEFDWYYNGVKLDYGEQSLYIGANAELKPEDAYRVELKAEGAAGTLRSCEGSIEPEIPAAPKAGKELKGDGSEIYDVKGRHILGPAGSNILMQKNKSSAKGKLP
jgi:uncharacterized protein (TIGR02145 family)